MHWICDATCLATSLSRRENGPSCLYPLPFVHPSVLTLASFFRNQDCCLLACDCGLVTYCLCLCPLL